MGGWGEGGKEEEEEDDDDVDDEEAGQLVEIGPLLLPVVLLHVVALDPLALLSSVPLAPGVLRDDVVLAALLVPFMGLGLLLLPVMLINVVAINPAVLLNVAPLLNVVRMMEDGSEGGREEDEEEAEDDGDTEVVELVEPRVVALDPIVPLSLVLLDLDVLRGDVVRVALLVPPVEFGLLLLPALLFSVLLNCSAC